MRGDRWGFQVKNAFVLRLPRTVVKDYACPFGLSLVSTVLSEISDDWETERSYLNMEAC